MQNSALNSFNPYLRNQIVSASPIQLVVLLYDGVIRFLHTAEEAFDETDLQTRFENIHTNLLRAQSIITELDTCLDMQLGGDVARQLQQLYAFFNRTLFQANLSKDKALIVHVCKLITELRDTWQQIAQAENQPVKQTLAQAV